MQNTHHEEHKHHITPISVYLRTFAALIFLTIVTVGSSYFDFGAFNLALALLIASTKAILVMWFFMQLKYDDLGNKVTFYSSFLFLAIFLGFTAADIFVRQEVKPMHIEQVSAGGETAPQKLNKSNAGLVNKGKDLYAQQCVSCHGPSGMGDGVAAAALNPKPRNFKSGYWKFGGSPSKIFRTLTQGSPGTAMGAFTTLSVEDRYALAHYVRSISTPVPTEDSAEDTKEAVQIVSASGGSGAAKSEIPIDYAMERMETKDQIVLPAEAKNPSHPGAYLFQAQCAQCHGAAGQGAQVAAIGINPPVSLITKSLAEASSHSSWGQSEAEFIKVVSEGIPGRGMPGMGGYSSQEWSALYNYVKSLR